MNDLLLPAIQKSAQDLDPYYNLVSLHLKGDVNTGRSYNAFSDASSNNFRLTNNGDVRGSSFSPYNTSWSNYFSGSSQYLSVADSTAFTLGSGDFTVEAWVYKISTGRQAITGQTDSVGANTSASFGLEINASNKVVGSVCSGATGYLATSTADIVLNQWNHIAFVRDGNTLRLYINGVQDGTASVTGITVNDSTNQLAIGRLGEYASLYWIGYISNCRLVKGRCVYPSGTTFNPSTAPLTRTTGGTNPPQGTECSLLTCQSNRFIDNSIANTGGTPFTITVNGSPTVSSFSPFLETDTTSGSGYFDGTGDWLNLPLNSAFDLATNPCCLEAWVYLTSSTNFYLLGTSTNTAGQTRPNFLVNQNRISFDYYGTVILDSSSTLNLNSWNHVCWTRASTSGPWRAFINGTLAAYATNTASLLQNGAFEQIGAFNNGNTAPGYVSNLRIVNGSVPVEYQTSSTTVGTSIFTPPTTPLTVVANTQLLTLQERGAYNTIGFQDESEYQHLITRNGNVAQGTFSPFSPAGWSSYSAGEFGNYWTVSGGMPSGQGTAFSLECWIYLNNLSAYRTISRGTSSGSLDIGVTTAGTLTIDNTNITNIASSVTGAVQVNRWHHVLITRTTGNVYTVYIDGIGGTPSGAYNTSMTANTTIGYNSFSQTYNFSGYISNLRVTNTVIQSGNFNPPTEPLTAITGTQLLIFQNNRFVDNSSSPKTIAANGSPIVAAFSPFKPPAYDPQVHGGSGYFDGTGDYLLITNISNLFDVGSAFTLETWIYTSTYNANNSYFVVGGTANDWNTSTGIYHQLYADATNIYYQTSNGAGGTTNVISVARPTAGQWNHIVVGYNGTTTRMWINGSSVATSTSTYNKPSGTNRISIGAAVTGANASTGYLSNLRFVKADVYNVANSTITVSTTPLSLLGNTSLLLNFTNAGVIDSTGKNVIETVGNAGVVTTSIKKYGSGSMFFDGTGDYLQQPLTNLLSFAENTYTIEAWIYPTTSSGYRRIFSTSTSAASTVGYLALVVNGTSLVGETRPTNNGAVTTISGGTVNANTWYHAALSVNNGSARLFLDGVQVGSTTSFPALAAMNYVTVGAILYNSGASTTDFFTGYIDDLRITRGYARYVTGTGANANQMVFNGTNTLALPTKALPDRGTASTLTTDMAAPSSVEYLVVAGGGAGGGSILGGGGGAGGVLTGSMSSLTLGTTYNITVGAGGAGVTNSVGGSGSNSIFNALTAIGGGGGGYQGIASLGTSGVWPGNTGGSGGGSGGGSAVQASGTVGQGNSGGYSNGVPDGYGAGGGGGAGAAGGNATTANGAPGGSGIYSSITGTNVAYAGGGGGGVRNTGGSAGSGGVGGGAAGINSSSATPPAGSSNTGGGGGGVGSNVGGPGSYPGGAGGSGVVILAYPTSFRPLKASLGLVYTIDTVTRPGYRVYKFTAGTGTISW